MTTFPETNPHDFKEDDLMPSRCAFRSGLGFKCGYPRHLHRWPCSPTCTHDDAWTPGHPERVKERSEAVKDVGTYTPAAASAYEQGAEAMRAACWEAALSWLERSGMLGGAYERELKAAIEGATP